MKRGKGYAVNVPLRDGITDEAFHSIFKPVSDAAIRAGLQPLQPTRLESGDLCGHRDFGLHSLLTRSFVIS
jgi:histone deacetylase 1/2